MPPIPSAPALLLPVLIGALAAGTGCGPAMTDPEVRSVTPEWGYSGEDTPVSIAGEGFYPQVEPRTTDDVDLDRQYRVYLSTDPASELTSVEVIDYDQLEATVPSGLPAGTYHLRVESPAGRSGVLIGAFEVRDTRADRLSVSADADDFTWEVLEFAVLDLQLLDRDGQRVAEDLPITVSVDPEQAGALFFQADTLEDQELSDDGATLRGSLGGDGRATVALTSGLPIDELLVRIAPDDAEAGVTGTGLYLAFEAGAPSGIELSLPELSVPPTVTAGESFALGLRVVDVFGNTVEDAAAELALVEGCAGGTLFDTVSFVGATDATVSLTRSTGDSSCEENAVVALGVAGAASVSGESPGITVEAGEADALQVEVWPDAVVAGNEDLYLLVDAVDAYSNRDRDRNGTLSVRMQVDGGPPETPAEVDCEPLIDGRATCRVGIDTAGESVLLTVSTVEPEPITGSAAPVEVQAGTAVSLEVSLDGTTPAEAGTAFTLDLRALDELDNGVLLDILDADSPTLDGGGDLECSWQLRVEPRGTERFACTGTVAADAREITATLPSRGLSATTAPFSLVNGPLASVDIDLSITTATAGEAFTVSLAGQDAWDNAWIVQDDPVVSLTDLTGTLTPATATLGADGTVDVDVTVTRARSADRLRVARDASDLGSSATFDVLGGDPAALQLLAEGSFLWVGEASPLTVAAVDAWGNIATSFDAPVTVSSEDGLADDVVVDSFTRGEASLDLTPDVAALETVLAAAGGGLAGSLVLDFLDDACIDAPTADLEIAGEDSPSLCIRPVTGRTSPVDVDATASTAGAAALVAWHFSDGAGEWTRSEDSVWSGSWSEPGGVRLDVVVADADACADHADAVVWVGETDGSATGPVSVTPDGTALGTDSDLEIDLTALDCAGDPAEGSLLVRVDAGQLDEDDVDRSGRGLEVDLDALGTATARWQAGDALPGGTGNLQAGTATGSAHGSTSVLLTDDAVPPRVTAMSPAGTLLDDSSTIQLSLSEAILDRSVRGEAFTLEDEAGGVLAVADEELTLSSDGRTLTLSPAVPLDTSEVAWTLTIGGDSASLRDEAGNRLDGDGSDGPFRRTFGAVPDAAPDTTVGACARSTATFRPDGDPGVGIDADTVDLTGVADGPVAWWRTVIRDSDGDTVYTAWTDGGDDTVATLAWDGRSDRGRILSPDTYTVILTPADDAWNTGLSCQTTVTLDQRVEAP